MPSDLNSASLRETSNRLFRAETQSFAETAEKIIVSVYDTFESVLFEYNRSAELVEACLTDKHPSTGSGLR